MKIYENVLLIDLSYSLHRCLRQPNLWELKTIVKNDDGELEEFRTGGIYGVFNSLQKVMKMFPGYKPIFASDKGLSSRRLSLQPNYKRTEDRRKEREIPEIELTEEQLQERKDSEEYYKAYTSSKREIRKISEAMGIPYIEIEGVEGDDILACLTTSNDVKKVVVVTDDRDLYQLLGIRYDIEIINYRALADEVVNQDIFKEEWKDIDNFVLCKSICGDSSDNIPQVAKGVGGKTAFNLITLMRDKGYGMIDITQESKLESGDFYGSQVYEGRGKNKKLVEDLTPVTSNPALNYLISQVSSKASRHFVKALCESNQLWSNVNMIDLRLIDQETKDKIMEEYSNQKSLLDGTSPNILKILPMFSRFMIKELNITEIVRLLQSNN